MIPPVGASKAVLEASTFNEVPESATAVGTVMLKLKMQPSLSLSVQPVCVPAKTLTKAKSVPFDPLAPPLTLASLELLVVSVKFPDEPEFLDVRATTFVDSVAVTLVLAV